MSFLRVITRDGITVKSVYIYGVNISQLSKKNGERII